MAGPLNFNKELKRFRNRNRREEDALLVEARRILHEDLFADRKILANLENYNRSFGKLDERELQRDWIFTEPEIRQLAICYRLRFLKADLYRPGLPYEAGLMISDLNEKHRKDLKDLYILAPSTSFHKSDCDAQSALFAETSAGNFYFIHRWGKALPLSRKFKYWPLRSFENLAVSVLVFTLLLTLALPTEFITLDGKATYWSGYRAAAFFHLLIFNSGFTIYLTFAFSRNFSSTVWNRKKDFI